MIAYIKGTIHSYTSDSVIVDHNGMGYRVVMANPSKYVLKEEVCIFTYQHIREDAQILFGFSSIQDHDLFLRLISVKGIGPKIAMQALGASTSTQIISNIEAGDVAALKALPGIGPKAASQIVLDLKGKLVESSDIKEVNVALQEAMDALKALGYKPNELQSIRKELSKELLSVDGYVRKALSLMLKKKGL